MNPQEVNQTTQDPQPVPAPTPLTANPSTPTPFTGGGVPVSTNGKSKKVIVLIVAVIAALAAVLGAAYFLFLNPAAQAQKASAEFMSAATSGDLDTLYKVSEAEDEDMKSFLKSISDSIKGSGYALLDKTSRDGKWYFLYEVKGAERSRARTIVEKKDGSWEVTSIVVGDEGLRLVPQESSASEDTGAETDTAQKSAGDSASALKCLALEDYRWMNYDKSVPSVDYTVASDGFVSEKEDSMFFKPDSIEETSFASTYDDWAEFATKNLDKSWTFELRGTTNDKGNNTLALDGSVSLATERANEVKRELVSRGVPENRIVIGDIINNQDEYLDGSYQAEIFRRVSLTIKNPCPGQGLQPGSAVGR